MQQPKTNTNWFTSDEARKALRISTCELMHLRESGALRFQKRGNAFLYSAEDVDRRKRERGHEFTR